MFSASFSDPSRRIVKGELRAIPIAIVDAIGDCEMISEVDKRALFIQIRNIYQRLDLNNFEKFNSIIKLLESNPQLTQNSISSTPNVEDNIAKFNENIKRDSAEKVEKYLLKSNSNYDAVLFRVFNNMIQSYIISLMEIIADEYRFSGNDKFAKILRIGSIWEDKKSNLGQKVKSLEDYSLPKVSPFRKSQVTNITNDITELLQQNERFLTLYFRASNPNLFLSFSITNSRLKPTLYKTREESEEDFTQKIMGMATAIISDKKISHDDKDSALICIRDVFSRGSESDTSNDYRKFAAIKEKLFILDFSLREIFLKYKDNKSIEHINTIKDSIKSHNIFLLYPKAYFFKIDHVNHELDRLIKTNKKYFKKEEETTFENLYKKREYFTGASPQPKSTSTSTKYQDKSKAEEIEKLEDNICTKLLDMVRLLSESKNITIKNKLFIIAEINQIFIADKTSSKNIKISDLFIKLQYFVKDPIIQKTIQDKEISGAYNSLISLLDPNKYRRQQDILSYILQGRLSKTSDLVLAIDQVMEDLAEKKEENSQGSLFDAEKLKNDINWLFEVYKDKEKITGIFGQVNSDSDYTILDSLNKICKQYLRQCHPDKARGKGGEGEADAQKTNEINEYFNSLKEVISPKQLKYVENLVQQSLKQANISLETPPVAPEKPQTFDTTTKPPRPPQENNFDKGKDYSIDKREGLYLKLTGITQRLKKIIKHKDTILDLKDNDHTKKIFGYNDIINLILIKGNSTEKDYITNEINDLKKQFNKLDQQLGREEEYRERFREFASEILLEEYQKNLNQCQIALEQTLRSNQININSYVEFISTFKDAISSRNRGYGELNYYSFLISEIAENSKSLEFKKSLKSLELDFVTCREHFSQCGEKGKRIWDESFNNFIKNLSKTPQTSVSIYDWFFSRPDKGIDRA